MKVGQQMSILESALPEDWVAPYRAQLTALQDSAPPMPTQTVRDIIEGDLGPGWRDQLVEFDPMPAAAASIGQVHQGTWADGRRVAVKVQYPGADEALMSDLRQIARLAKTVGTMLPGVDVKPLVEELMDRARDELDYALEAEAQHAFAVAFRDDPMFVVPDVVAHGQRVLVTEWLDSTGSLAAVIRDGTQEERDHYGELFVRFLFAGPSHTGMLHADPHPGQLPGDPERRWLPGPARRARLRRRGPAPRWRAPEAMGSLIRIACRRDAEQLLDGLRQEGFVRPNVKVEPAQLNEYLAPFVEPASVERFRFSREWMRAQFPADQRPARARLHVDAQAQPAPVVHAHPPHLAGRHRRDEPARRRGPLPRHPHRVPPRLRRRVSPPTRRRWSRRGPVTRRRWSRGDR
jgi:hypothetical protein